MISDKLHPEASIVSRFDKFETSNVSIGQYEQFKVFRPVHAEMSNSIVSSAEVPPSSGCSEQFKDSSFVKPAKFKLIQS